MWCLPKWIMSPLGQGLHLLSLCVTVAGSSFSEHLWTIWLAIPSSKLWTTKSVDCFILNRMLFPNCVKLHTYTVLCQYHLMVLINKHIHLLQLQVTGIYLGLQMLTTNYVSISFHFLYHPLPTSFPLACTEEKHLLLQAFVPILVYCGCCNRVPKTGLKQQTFIVSQFWRPEVWNQGVIRAVFPL